MIYSILLIIVAGAVLNSIFSKYAPKKLNFRRKISKKVLEVKEEFEIELIVENRKILPVTYLQIEERLNGSFEYKYNSKSIIRDMDSVYHRAVMMIAPYQRVKRTYKLYPTKRGLYFIQDIKLVVGDFLGLGFKNEAMTFQHEIVVLPETYDIEKNLVLAGDFNGNISVKRWIMEDPVLTIGVREYTGLEPQKNIHWPSSLRAGKLMVKSFDYTTDSKAVILLNIETNKPFWLNINGDKVERCISMARSFAEKLEEMGIPYGLATNAQMGNFIDETNIAYPGLGENHLYYILEGLGRISYGISDDFETYLQKIISFNGRYSTYIIVTPSVFEDYIEYINILSKKCEKLILISLSDMNLEQLDEKIVCLVEREDEV